MKNNKYIDTSVGLYTDNYPILSLSNSDVFENYTDNLEGLLKNCIWFQYASKNEKKHIVDKLRITSGLMEEIKKIIEIKYPNSNIMHISIGGSYLFEKNEINDIDFNIVVSGNHFSYTDIFEVEEINKKLPISVKKISLMIFGEDDFLSKTDVDDNIETTDYIHTLLRMRV